MTRKTGIIIPMLLFMFLSISAQKGKPQFSTINSAGALFGQGSPEWLFQTVNGFKYQDLFVGIGLGVDQYAIRSLPLFLDVRMNFGQDKKGFVYGDLGHNFFLKDTRKNDFPIPDLINNYSGGIYTDIGVGLRASFIKKVKMVVSIGHSFKKMHQQSIGHVCPFIPPCYEDVTKYEYGYGRFNLKLGLAL